jgi:hypothetical protein
LTLPRNMRFDIRNLYPHSFSSTGINTKKKSGIQSGVHMISKHVICGFVYISEWLQSSFIVDTNLFTATLRLKLNSESCTQNIERIWTKLLMEINSGFFCQ